MISLSDPTLIQQQEIAEYANRYRINFINSLSGFKSANLIGTRNEKGQENLALFSSAVHIGANPPLIGLVSRPDTVERHTLENIRETGLFTINHVNRDIYTAAHQCAARLERNESEFDESGLKPEYLNDFAAPFVKESDIKMAMELTELIPIKSNGTWLIIAELRFVIVPASSITNSGVIDIESSGTVTVSGLDSYHETRKLHRLSYPKKGKPVSVITSDTI